MSKKYQYTLDDCACSYCLYFDARSKTCQIDICCCLAEKEAALARMQIGSEETRKCAG